MHELTQEEYEKLILEHSDFKHEIEDIEHRLMKCENQQEAMVTLTRSVDRLTLTVSNMVEEQKELKADVKNLKEAPADNFKYYKRTLVSCIITTIVGAIVGAVIALIIQGGV
jgi:predicted  nucleic acid-binding Zn-ribbon protein